MIYKILCVISIILQIIAVYQMHVRRIRDLSLKDKQIQELRANFAIYYNASEMEILYLKDELKKLDSQGVDFSESTRKKIEKDLQTDINQDGSIRVNQKCEYGSWGI